MTPMPAADFLLFQHCGQCKYSILNSIVSVFAKFAKNVRLRHSGIQAPTLTLRPQSHAYVNANNTLIVVFFNY